jgi:hypothetical protein
MVIQSNAVVDEGAVMVHSQSTCEGRVMPAGDGDGGRDSDGDGGGDGDGGSGGGIQVKNATT